MWTSRAVLLGLRGLKQPKGNVVVHQGLGNLDRGEISVVQEQVLELL